MSLEIEDDLRYLPDSWQQAYLDNQEILPAETPPEKKGIAGAIDRDTLSTFEENYLKELQEIDEITRSQINDVRTRDFAEFHSAMEEFVSELSELKKETGIPLEKILHEILKGNREINEERTEVSKAQIKNNQKELREVHKKRIERMRDLISKAEKTAFWNRFAKAAEVVGTVVGVAAAVATMGSGTPAVIIGCILIAEAADGLLGDPAKKAAISAVTTLLPVEGEKKKQVEDISIAGVKVAFALASLVAAYKYLPKAATEVSKLPEHVNNFKTAATATQVVTQGASLKYEYEGQKGQGKLTKESFQSRELHEKIKNDTKSLGSILQRSIDEFWKPLQNVEESKTRMIQEIFR